MIKEPAPDERYQDVLTKNVLEVVALATSAETCQRIVIYRLGTGKRLFTLSLDRWEEMLETETLAFIGWAVVATHYPQPREAGTLRVSHAL
jgi:hypothetical protein